MNDIFNKHLVWEKELERLLKKNGFSVRTAHRFGGFADRPDFIVEKNGKVFIVELKVSNIITEKTLYQIMYYREKNNSNFAYLAIPKELIIKKDLKKKLLDNNIGIITIQENELIFENPTSTINLSDTELEKYEKYSEDSKTQEELRAISTELVIYIFAGGLFVGAISNLLELLLGKQCYSWVALIICGLIIGVFVLCKFKRK